MNPFLRRTGLMRLNQSINSGMFLLITLLVNLAPVMADASESESAYQQLLSVQSEYHDRSLITEVAFRDSAPQRNRLARGVVARLREVAKDQAYVWSDTILEGDYVADETAFDLDKVQVLKRGHEIIGYRITYSTEAWDVSGESCHYYGDYRTMDLDPLRFAGCDRGRITESSFVSLSFETYFRDDRAYASFQD